MSLADDLTPEPLARWSSRLALFSGALLLIALVAHRLAALSTPVMLTVIGVSFAIAAIGILVGLAAAVSIWIRGRKGALPATMGILLGLAMFAWPAAYAGPFFALPPINDISTDTSSPPSFNMLGRVRGEGANRPVYPGPAAAALQSKAYPDLRTFVVDRSADEVFDLAVLLVRGRRGLGWKVLVEEAPSVRPPRAGLIEATERTLVLGFVDDIAIRIFGNERQARVDVRSASRFGRHDFGANASRIRRFLRELQSRLDATVPAAIASTGGVSGAVPVPGRGAAAGAKRPKERSPAKAGARNARDPARPDAPRAPGSKGPPRG